MLYAILACTVHIVVDGGVVDVRRLKKFHHSVVVVDVAAYCRAVDARGKACCVDRVSCLDCLYPRLHFAADSACRSLKIGLHLVELFLGDDVIDADSVDDLVVGYQRPVDGGFSEMEHVQEFLESL